MMMRALVLTSCLCAAVEANVQCVDASRQTQNCTSGDVCCGAGTFSPTCMNPNAGLKCCQQMMASRVCNVTAGESCCGGGSGISSFVTCCEKGSRCCNADWDQDSLCCPNARECCYTTGQPQCCGLNQKCGQQGCVDLPPTPPVTPAPPTTPLPPATPEPTACSVCKAGERCCDPTVGQLCPGQIPCCDCGTKACKCPSPGVERILLGSDANTR